MVRFKEVRVVVSGSISREEIKIISRAMLVANLGMRGKEGIDTYDLKRQAAAIVSEYLPPNDTPGKILNEHCFFTVIEET